MLQIDSKSSVDHFGMCRWKAKVGVPIQAFWHFNWYSKPCFVLINYWRVRISLMWQLAVASFVFPQMLDPWTPPLLTDDQPPDLITKHVPVHNMAHSTNKGMEYSIITCTAHNIQCTLWTWLNSIIVQGLVPPSLLQYHTDQGAQTRNNGGSHGMEMDYESRLHAICVRFQWVAWPILGHWRIGCIFGIGMAILLWSHTTDVN